MPTTAIAIKLWTRKLRTRIKGLWSMDQSCMYLSKGTYNKTDSLISSYNMVNPRWDPGYIGSGWISMKCLSRTSLRSCVLLVSNFNGIPVLMEWIYDRPYSSRSKCEPSESISLMANTSVSSSSKLRVAVSNIYLAYSSHVPWIMQPEDEGMSVRDVCPSHDYLNARLF